MRSLDKLYENEKHYTYEGPVIATSIDKCIMNKWKSETYAISEKKARSNMIFQFKKQNKRYGIGLKQKISLPGKLIEC